MFNVNGKFYSILTLLMNLFIINFLFTVLSLPLLTLPVTFLYLCYLVLNIFQNKKLFAKAGLTKAIWRKALPTFGISLLSLISVYLLSGSGLNFVAIFAMAVLITFNSCIYFLLLLFDMKLMQLYRMAFFYMLAFFYKTIVLCLGAVILAIVAWNTAPWLIIVILFSGFAYLFIKLNFGTMTQLFKQDSQK